MRVNGRLRHAPIAYNAKYPIILPKDGHFTKLVIEHFHKITGCSGYNTTLAATRQHFWIVNSPTTVKRYTRTCVKCRERDAKPLEQVMASLPEVRLATGRLPGGSPGRILRIYRKILRIYKKILRIYTKILRIYGKFLRIYMKILRNIGVP